MAFSFYQGASIDLSFGAYPPRNISAWVCRVQVKKTTDASPLVSKTLTLLSPDNYNFIGSITPAETASIAPGKYKIIADLTDNTGALNTEIVKEIRITKQYIPA